jgi:hypothetical protein
MSEKTPAQSENIAGSHLPLQQLILSIVATRKCLELAVVKDLKTTQ